MSNPAANGSGTPPLRITGGAGPYETAAIAAVVELVVEQERRAVVPVRGRFSNWVLVSRSGSAAAGSSGWRLPRRVNRPVSAGGARPVPVPRPSPVE